MKYAYVVTRIVTSSDVGMTHIPNLGVHSSEVKAYRHWRNVKADRIKRGATAIGTIWRNDQVGPYQVIAELMIKSVERGAEVYESLRIERWMIQ